MLAFRERLAQPGLILLDGAMGTELESRGVDTSGPAWSARALLEAPQIIEQIHLDYLEAGAELLTANTFRTQQRALGREMLGAKALVLTRNAVQLALEAIQQSGKTAYVAGSMSPLEDCYEPELVPSKEELALEHTLHAENLALAGADLLLIETMNTAREARAAAEAAQATGLPYGISYVCADDGKLLSGESLAEAVGALAGLHPDFLGINCVPAGVLDRALVKLLAATEMPLAVYGNIGHTNQYAAWQQTRDYNPVDYSKVAELWQSEQIKILGGCCGTGPEHIAAIGSINAKERN